MARLAAHHAPAHNAPRALDGNAALRALDEHNEGHHGDHARNQQGDRHDGERAPGVGLDLLVKFRHAARQAGHNAGKDQQAHAVADAAIGNLLAQPHDERRARGQREHRHQAEADARIQHQALLGENGRDADRLQRPESPSCSGSTA
jgi:hypothetical protein